MASQYKTIRGVRYEQKLLKLAGDATRNGGLLTKAAAQEIWRLVEDRSGVTQTERRTVEYILEHFRPGDAAKAFLAARLEETQLAECATAASSPQEAAKRPHWSKEYYRTVGGVKYKAALLRMAEDFLSTSPSISWHQAANLWGKANDGSGVTDTERRTLEHILSEFPFDRDAREFLSKALGGVARPALGGRDKETLKVEDQSGGSGGSVMTKVWRAISWLGFGSGGQPHQAASGPEQPQALCDEGGTRRGKREPPPGDGRGGAGRSRALGSGGREDKQPSHGRPAPERTGRDATVAGSSGRRSRPRSRSRSRQRLRGSQDDQNTRGGCQGAAAGASADLAADLQDLLSEGRSGQASSHCLELPYTKEFDDARQRAEDLSRLRAAAAAEVQRIRRCRRAADILGGGSKAEQKQEFHRLALLLHPDKDLVSGSEGRQAWDLVWAAYQRCRRGT